MKTRLVVLIGVIMMSSCMTHYCPTYSGSKKSHAVQASSKKAGKSSKTKMLAKKSLKLAETD